MIQRDKPMDRAPEYSSEEAAANQASYGFEEKEEAMRLLFAKEEAEAKRVADEAAAEKKEKEAKEEEEKEKQKARDKSVYDEIARLEAEIREKDAELTSYKDSQKQLAEANRAFEAKHNEALAANNKKLEEVKDKMRGTTEKLANKDFMIPSSRAEK
jgi:hypothetical protein